MGYFERKYIEKKIKKRALKGKNVIICGGSKGIGKETAILFTKLGANILVIARNVDALEKTKQECLRNDFPAFHPCASANASSGPSAEFQCRGPFPDRAGRHTCVKSYRLHKCGRQC